MVKHAVILAGGAGTRLWPASTRKHPKQFMRLGRERSLFALTLQRAIGLGLQGMICVVTHRDHAEAIAEECRAVVEGGSFAANRIVILPEPEGRNTAPALAYACAVLSGAGFGEDTLIVMPADHMIEPLSKFAEDVDRAARLAEQDWLVTFGIQPQGPETGYGYIEAGDALETGLEVRRFKEKPDAATARSFLAEGNHYWNSGMFAFRAECFRRQLQQHAPQVARAFSGSVAPQWRARGASIPDGPQLVPPDDALQAAYGRTPSISIDYAVMEHSRRCALIPAGFAWSDVGSWDVVAELFASRPDGGAADSVIGVEAERNFVFSDLPVALAGVEDLIVVVKNGAVLICRKGQTQLVRDLVQSLKQRDRTDLL